MFLCNPALWMAAAWLVKAAARRRCKPQMLLSWLLMLLHLFCLLLHKSFGGFQFGARYTLELIPYAVAMLHFSPRRAPRAPPPPRPLPPGPPTATPTRTPATTCRGV